MAITLQTTVQRRRNALAADVGGEVVVMSVEHSEYHGLDSVASDVWRRIASPIVVADLCEALTRNYLGERSRIEREVIELLEKLSTQNLLEPLA